MIRRLFGQIDDLLRGSLSKKEDMREGRVAGSVRGLIVSGLVLGIVYGAFMGLYAVLRPKSPSYAQLLVTSLKVPLLFLLTLGVTFPSLYVSSALANSPLRFLPTARLLLMAIVVNLALLSSFGPVTGFFTVSTESYRFMLLLNVIFFGISGLAGLGFLGKAIDGIFEAPAAGPTGEGSPAEGPPASTPPSIPAPRRLSEVHRGTSTRGRSIFVVWMVIFGAVGAQMGWILRPFVGSPDLPFQLFRVRESNFFECVFRTIRNLLS